MKFIILALLVLSASCSITYNQFGRSIIEEVNADPTSTWVAGHNEHWENFPLLDVKRLMGAKKTPSWMKLPETDLLASEALPDSFDSRDAWPSCESIKEVRDQSNCGSCWAFGAAEAMSDRLCIASNQTVQTRVSTQDLVTCCHTCGDGCDGGYLDQSWRYFVVSGLVTGDLYDANKTSSWCRPYTLEPCDHHTTGKYKPCPASTRTPACTKQCTPQSNRTYATDKLHGKTAYSVSGAAKIQTEIMTFGPVEAAFTVYEDFPTYKSGVYQHKTGGELGGHAIKILGWGVEDNTPYWLVANSWNEDWGMQGFFKILRGKNECGIEEQVVAGK